MLRKILNKHTPQMKAMSSDYETKTGSGDEEQILFKVKMEERDIDVIIMGGFEYILLV